MSFGAIVLVGGMGTRLRPLTLHQPKALLPILNRPFLSYQFDALHKAGVRDVCLAANPWFKKWKTQLEKLAPKGLRLYWAFEPKPLGTGGAIRYGFDRLIAKRPGLSQFFVLNGDVLISADLSKALDFHVRSSSKATLSLTRVADVSRFGLVDFTRSGRIVAFKEKPKKGSKRGGWINAGIYLMTRDFIERIPSGHALSVERDVFPAFLKLKGLMMAHLIRGYWNDIGTPATYLQAHADLTSQKHIWTANRNFNKGIVPRGSVRAVLGPGSRVPRSSSVSGFVVFGKGVVIGSESNVENSVLMDGCRVGHHCQLHGVILGRSCVIGDGAHLTEGTVLGDRTVLPPYTKS